MSPDIAPAYSRPGRRACAALLLVCACLAPPAIAVDEDEAAEQVVAYTNAFRREQGLDPVAPQQALQAAAAGFARYMADTGRYGHGADGRQPAERAAADGYDYCIVAENIGYQYRSTGFESAEALARSFVEGWENSPEHRKNLVDQALTEIGAGLARDASGRYFAVQLFGRPKAAAIRFEVRNRAGRAIQYQAGGRSYSLAMGQGRIHLECRPGEISVAHPSQGAPFTARPHDGARYTVRSDGVVAQ